MVGSWPCPQTFNYAEQAFYENSKFTAVKSFITLVPGCGTFGHRICQSKGRSRNWRSQNLRKHFTRVNYNRVKEAKNGNCKIIINIYGTFIKRSSLQNRVSKFTPKMFYEIDPSLCPLECQFRSCFVWTLNLTQSGMVEIKKGTMLSLKISILKNKFLRYQEISICFVQNFSIQDKKVPNQWTDKIRDIYHTICF